MAKRILIAGFTHETNTFSVMPADMAAFRARRLIEGDDIPRHYRGTGTEIGAILDACRDFDWTPETLIAADAAPSGPVTREVWDFVTSRLLGRLRRGPRPDALFLNLHGAMVTDMADDGEGELLKLVRAEVGPAMPIAVTLDLHANVSDAMAALADIMVSYRKYPHTDMYETGMLAARLLKRMLDGEIRPSVKVARAATIDGVDMGRTTAPGPMLDTLALADRLAERTPGVLAVSINAGFAWADIPFAGPTAVVVGDGHDKRHQQMADKLAEYIFERRAEKTISPLTAKEAVERAKTTGRPGSPVVIADYADNPGGGGYGDATGLLAAMLAARLENAAFCPVFDPISAAACHEAGAGKKVHLRLGGRIDSRFGQPLDIEGVVTALSPGSVQIEGAMSRGLKFEMGPSAAVRVGGLVIVVVSRRFQNFDLVFFKALGIEPAACSVIGLKSAQHFRAAYTPIAAEILVVDEGGGVMTHDFTRFPFRKVRRPVWPLDP
ncbi:MAG: M81 family metallopeptidase [Hyphomicrobiaceae bacterium]|nr:MAG: M81 family metallopeptidase [Hyphomicrobiaceae bacterium]